MGQYFSGNRPADNVCLYSKYFNKRRNEKMKKRLSIILMLATLVSAILPLSGVLAATTAVVTVTATPEFLAMTNNSGNWTIGAIAEATTVWFTNAGTAPAEPFVDGDMKGTLTNTGSITSDIAIKAAAFTGGVGWAISTDNTPAGDEVSIRAGITGTANAAAMVQVITTDTDLKTSLAAAGTIKWCASLLTGTFSDGVAKSGAITFTISKS
jgi:hypothetical protein